MPMAYVCTCAPKSGMGAMPLTSQCALISGKLSSTCLILLEREQDWHNELLGVHILEIGHVCCGLLCQILFASSGCPLTSFSNRLRRIVATMIDRISRNVFSDERPKANMSILLIINKEGTGLFNLLPPFLSIEPQETLIPISRTLGPESFRHYPQGHPIGQARSHPAGHL